MVRAANAVSEREMPSRIGRDARERRVTSETQRLQAQLVPHRVASAHGYLRPTNSPGGGGLWDQMRAHLSSCLSVGPGDRHSRFRHGVQDTAKGHTHACSVQFPLASTMPAPKKIVTIPPATPVTIADAPSTIVAQRVMRASSVAPVKLIGASASSPSMIGTKTPKLSRWWIGSSVVLIRVPLAIRAP